MANISIAVLNSSTVLKDDEVAPVVLALQKQVTRDFAPAWGMDAVVTFVSGGNIPPPSSWQLVILDNSDRAGALGYHDLTPLGLPLGKVFAGTDKQNNLSWSVTASHELLEMLADPDINLTAFVQSSAAAGRLYAYEVCDPCEDDSFGYTIDNVLVSDFVYPSWFESFWQAGTVQFDFANKIQNPFELLMGGYIGVFDIGKGSGWHQLNADLTQLRYHYRAHVGSRRERRNITRNQWMRSRGENFCKESAVVGQPIGDSASFSSSKL